MIKFFRKIRQNLLMENKTGEYLKYAVGEIFLVITGILIALSINNWNTNKLDRISEADYLKRLSNDLVSDTLTYNWTYKLILEKQEALGNVIAHLTNNENDSMDSISLLYNLRQGMNFTFAHPKPVTSTFEELKNTGNFIKIENSEMRSIISKYYFEVEHQYKRIEQKRISPNYGDEIDKIIPDLGLNNGEINYRGDLVSYNEIVDNINNPEFKKLVISEFNLAVFMQPIQKKGLKESKILLSQIKDELVKLQN